MTLIRTTYHGRLAAMQRSTSRSAERLSQAQREASTGLSYSRPSDDPGRTSRIQNFQELQKDQEVWQDNAEWTDGILNRADSALSTLADALADARVLAVQMSSEEYNADQRIDAAVTGQAMLEQALEAGNAQFGDRYIFAGTSYDAAAYDTAGLYLGDTGQPEVPVAEGLRVASGFDGSALLQGAAGDIIGAFTNLVANLTTGSATSVQSSLDDIEDAVAQLSEAQAVVGGEMRLGMDAMDLAASLEIELSAEVAGLTEVDMAQSYSDLFLYQQSYDAALQLTAATRSSLLFSRI
jgi:flagellar hook-associated protein 3 FlgL